MYILRMYTLQSAGLGVDRVVLSEIGVFEWGLANRFPIVIDAMASGRRLFVDAMLVLLLLLCK